MRFTSTIAAAVLSLAVGSQAWAQDPKNGIWTANNNVYRINDSEWPRQRDTVG
jgi:hypothetical protein